MNEGLLVSNGEPGPAPRKKSCRLIVRAMAYSLLTGVSLCLLFYPSFIDLFMPGRSKVPDDGRPEKDLFTGEWIQDPSGPAYTNASCNFIESPQNCMTNGRPDTLYLYWKWKPYGSDIPPFDAEKFMNAMRDKSWALIGDSIFRNHIQSLLCFLSKVEVAVEVYHDKEYKSRTWYFPSHNFTLALIWAPLLVQAETSENSDGKAKAPIQLHIDVLDKNWTSVYHNYDYIFIGGGQWFMKTMIIWENSKVIGCHSCTGEFKELDMDFTYRRSLELALRFIATSNHKPLVFFRTWTPSHFENGEWFSGGVCNRTLPYKEGQFSGIPSDNEMWNIEVEEFEKAAAIGSKNGARMKLLDIFHLSLLRPDGHPGPYRHPNPFANAKDGKVQNDCLHWCLPGPVDHWNDILMQMLLTEGELSDSTEGSNL